MSRQQRRFAAIPVADVSGFSAAMERDEEGTFLIAVSVSGPGRVKTRTVTVGRLDQVWPVQPASCSDRFHQSATPRMRITRFIL